MNNIMTKEYILFLACFLSCVYFCEILRYGMRPPHEYIRYTHTNGMRQYNGLHKNKRTKIISNIYFIPEKR